MVAQSQPPNAKRQRDLKPRSLRKTIERAGAALENIVAVQIVNILCNDYALGVLPWTATDAMGF